jgi:hypothetical protein
MKRSLFTILLRCGQNYDFVRGNFEEALNSVSYARNTQYAVKRFLEGNTKYTGNMRGWNLQFYWGGSFAESPKTPTNDAVDKLLIKPA